MPKTLLLADDSVTVQRVVELTFAHEDIRVVSVSDGRRAVQALDADGADIVLVDVEVPEIDGYGVAAHIRKSERLRDIPVLLLAGALGPVDEARARDLGCAGVLTKPFEPQVLVKKVKELLVKAPQAKPGGGSLRPARYRSSPEPLEPSRRPVWDQSAGGTTASKPAPAPPAPAPEPQKRVSLVEAFSALLGAESAAKTQPQAAPTPTPAGPPAAELEAAIRRVLKDMTAETVRQIVAETAERLVREEIERIKADSE